MTRRAGRNRNAARSASKGFGRLVFELCLGALGLMIVLGVATVSLSESEQTLFAVAAAIVFMVANRIPGRLVSVFLIMLSLGVSMRYFFWRATQTLTFGTWLEACFGILLVIAELYAITVLVFGYIQTIWPLERKVLPLPDDVDLWPTVDVFIPTYNESMSIVRATVLAAMAIDWPAEKIKVFILDDGRRDEFRRFAEQVGCGYMVRSDNKHAKAGNINAALARTDGEFVAIFDSDHIATRAYLQMSTGWLVADPNCAMVQTPHHFYSPDPFQRNLAAGTRVPSEGNMFYGLVQDGNDYWNATFFCGSCAVIRRSALDEIGGIAVETVTEDAHTMLKLHRRGWDSAYLRLPVAAGLATERLILHIGQRMRWARGMIQIFRTDCPMLGPGLTLGQRICYTQAMGHFFFAVPRIIFLCSPLCYLLLNQNIITASPLAICAYAIPHIFHSVATNSRLQKNFRHSFWSELYETTLALFLVKLTIATVLSPRHGKFNVTAKGGLLENGYFDLGAVYPNLILAVLLLVGVARGVINATFFKTDSLTFQALVLNSVWATFSLMTVLGALAVGRETRQIRSRARLRAQVPVTITLPSGDVVHGTTRDLSEGGAFIVADQPNEAVPEDWPLTFHLSDEAVPIPSRILRWDQKTLQISFQPKTIADESAIVRVVFGRADAWADWSNYENDRPLVSMWRVLVSIRGLFRPRDKGGKTDTSLDQTKSRSSSAGKRKASLAGAFLAVALIHHSYGQTTVTNSTDAGASQTTGGFVITPLPDNSTPEVQATPTAPSPMFTQRRRKPTHRPSSSSTAAVNPASSFGAPTDGVPLPPASGSSDNATSVSTGSVNPSAPNTSPNSETPAVNAAPANSPSSDVTGNDGESPVLPADQGQGSALPATNQAAVNQSNAYEGSTRKITYTLAQLGATGALQLRGVSTLAGVQFGIRSDEVVIDATLSINGALSPYMLPEWSNVTVTLNEQYVGTIPLNRDHPDFSDLGMSISPIFFQDDNRLNFKFTGHYTRDCEDPLSGLLWATIYDNTTLTLTLQRLPPQRDLARLPLPFFDRHEKTLFLQAMVLDANPSDVELQAAGIVSSWFGQLADYRGAKFPVTNDVPVDGNAVVFISGMDRARVFGLNELDGPTLAEIPNPNDSSGTLLLVAGRTDDEMLQAAQTLSVGSRTLGGETAVVDAPLLPTRVPYDAPNWVPTDRPVKFGELVDATSLQGTGYVPGTMRVPFRTAPDLFSWRTRNFPVKLSYRAPPGPIIDLAVSRIDVGINDLYLASYPLAQDPNGANGWFSRLFGFGASQVRETIDVPFFDVFGDNNLTFFFDTRPLHRGKCVAIPDDLRMGVDPDSTLDLSGAYRISKLPNLGYFVNSGFPFTRMADLSETAVIIPDNPTTAEITAYLDMAGRIGTITGLPVLKLIVVRPSETASVANRDLLLIGTMTRLGDAADLFVNSSYQVKDGRLSVAQGGVLSSVYRLFGDTSEQDRQKLVNQLSTPLTDDAVAMVGMESPLTKGRSLVALLAAAPQGLDQIVSDMRDPAYSRYIQGDLSILSGDQATSFRIGTTFTFGSVPFWVWPSWYLQDAPFSVLLVLLGGCFLLGIPFFWFLQRRAAKRLAGRPASK